ncbi:hypothetical protein IAU60_006045 [Kwoniella sp. DSM 27419]
MAAPLTSGPGRTHPNPIHRTSIPTSFSLSIPFFSRSSSSTTSFTTSSDLDLEQDLTSPGLVATAYSTHSGSTGQSHAHTLSHRSRSRPGLRKMPSWTSWSRSSSVEGMMLSDPSTDGDAEHIELGFRSKGRTVPGKASAGGPHRTRRLKLELGTWGRSPQLIFGSSRSSQNIKVRDSPKPKVAKVSSYTYDIVPLARVQARTDFGGPNVDAAVDEPMLDRERRGSDWPPTEARDLVLDLSILQMDMGVNMGDASTVSDTEGPSAEETGPRADSGRIDTPLELPPGPVLDFAARPSILSPVLDHEEDVEVDEFFTPSPMPTVTFAKTPFPSRIEMSEQPLSPVFDLDIFSPRPPPQPVLRGIIDSIPISPLDLPSLRVQAIPRHAYPPTSPLCMPMPRRGLPAQSIESVLNPEGPSSSTIGTERPSRPVNPGLPRRRMSLIMRPAILSCPTPPSLLTSPKSLGSEYVPPLCSPVTADPMQCRTAPATLGDSLPRRRGRGSLRLKLPPRQEKAEEVTAVDRADTTGEKEEHVATPGTFGLEGERERPPQGIINPYFD